MISIIQNLFEDYSQVGQPGGISTAAAKPVLPQNKPVPAATAKPTQTAAATAKPTQTAAGVPLKPSRYNIPGAKEVGNNIQKAAEKPEVNPTSVAQKTADKIDTTSAAQKTAETVGKEMSGTEAAGIAAQKGMKEVGEAGGSIAKKAAEFAGEHPMTAGLVGGAAAAYGLKKIFNRNKAQQSQY